MNICGVRFKDSGKTYYFKYEDIDLVPNETVVVETEKGEQYAKVIEANLKEVKKVDINKMKTVLRLSTEEDNKRYMKNLKDAKEALTFARDKALELDIDMRIIDSNFTLDRKQLTFNFIADERIDFRNLVKEIAAKYKTRIELHQMGVRDKSKEIGGLGQCGRELCCSKFLSGIDSISINMAKNQNIALNPSKINGACGRLLCCLSYEDDVYTCHREELPKIGESVNTSNGTGRVVNLDVLNKKYTVQIGEDKYEFQK